MARAKTLFETLAARADDPGALLAELNRGLAADDEAGMYLTAVLGSLDLDTGQLTFAAAGHDPPVLIRAAHAPEALADGGPMLGLLDHAAYPANRLHLAPGEAVLLYTELYTDGVPDAWNVADELFEKERLLAILQPQVDEPDRGVRRVS